MAEKDSKQNETPTKQDGSGKKSRRQTVSYTSMGLIVGVLFGVAYGAALDSYGIGVPLGVCMGVCIGAVLDRQRR